MEVCLCLYMQYLLEFVSAKHSKCIRNQITKTSSIQMELIEIDDNNNNNKLLLSKYFLMYTVSLYMSFRSLTFCLVYLLFWLYTLQFFIFFFSFLLCYYTTSIPLYLYWFGFRRCRYWWCWCVFLVFLFFSILRFLFLLSLFLFAFAIQIYIHSFTHSFIRYPKSIQFLIWLTWISLKWEWYEIGQGICFEFVLSSLIFSLFFHFRHFILFVCFFFLLFLRFALQFIFVFCLIRLPFFTLCMLCEFVQIPSFAFEENQLRKDMDIRKWLHKFLILFYFFSVPSYFVFLIFIFFILTLLAILLEIPMILYTTTPVLYVDVICSGFHMWLWYVICCTLVTFSQSHCILYRFSENCECAFYIFLLLSYFIYFQFFKFFFRCCCCCCCFIFPDFNQ